MISLYGRDFVMLMGLYIYVVMGQSQFIVVLAFRLFSFLSYIFIVVAKCCNCTSSTRIEKYTVGLNLPPQNLLRCVFGFEGISGSLPLLFSIFNAKIMKLILAVE